MEVHVQEMKTLLESRKSEILGRIEALSKDKSGALPSSLTEQAQVLENNEVVDQLDEIERKEFTQIEAALKRIENGQYGSCDSCGESISTSRLKALPYTPLCIQCAQDN